MVLMRPIMLAALAFGSLLMGTEAWSDEPPRVVQLQEGDRVVIEVDGTMKHYDRRGNPMPMADGTVMTASDGSRLLMKGGRFGGRSWSSPRLLMVVQRRCHPAARSRAVSS
jgi:hypothetical protein